MRKEVSVAEKAYKESLKRPLEEAVRIAEADIVVGIPFYDEADTIGHVVEVARDGLSAYYPDMKCVICCVGAPAGDKALEVIQHVALPQGLSPIAFLLKNEMVSGKGWALRAIMEIAEKLGGDLVILEADLLSEETGDELRGLSSEWLSFLLGPIRKEGFDLVLPRFNRQWLDVSISKHLIRPLIASLYNLKVQEPLGGELAISSEFLKTYLEEPMVWATDIGHFGIDVWLLTKAIARGANIAEAHLGVKLHRPSPGKEEIVLREQAKVIFEQVFLASNCWEEKGTCAPTSFGFRKSCQPVETKFNLPAHVARYRQGFNRFYALYQEIFPEKTSRKLEELAGRKAKEFDFASELWSEIVYDFLLAFHFDKRFTKGDILNAFIPLYEGRVAGFATALMDVEDELEGLTADLRERLVSLEAEKELEEQIEEFVQRKPAFISGWKGREEVAKPILPQITYREFIPGVPLILPRELTSPTGEMVNSDDVYKGIHEKYRQEFEDFVHRRLKVPREATSFEIAERVQAFIGRVERELDRALLQGDLGSVEGARLVVEAIWVNFPHQDTFALKSEVSSRILREFPPTNLLIKFGKSSITELEEEYKSNDILALSSFSEEAEYTERIWDFLRENARPEHFGRLPLNPLVVSYEEFPSLAEMKEASALSKLSGRIVVANLRKGIGGEFPKLRYFTMIAKNIVEAERFGEVWEEFASKKEFGRKIINSLKGHWGREPFSAHNVFENKHQRVLVQRLKEMAKELEQRRETRALSRLMEDTAFSYHLAQTFSDGKFVPCSAWTWASYSFKGGKGFPTPLSLHVERDWATREFLVELYHALGGSEKALDEKITELMGQGREWENLAKILFPEVKGAEEVLLEKVVRFEEPCAGELHRFEANPILEPIKGPPWESKYVFNPGAIRLEEKIYIIYRAMGEDMISRLGLATSCDGFHIEERLKAPIFEPEEEWERNGCEDPRFVVIDNRIYMLYTAYSSIAAQIALASIDVKDFLSYRWDKWQRHGPLFPGFSDKDAVLFPEKFDGRYAMYHRIEPSIWVSFSENLDAPWPRKDHRILMGPRAGMMWDGVKVGAGAQPIKTKYGWLLIYHGMDFAHVYRLGVLVVDLNDPGKVRYRSPNFILEPEESYEVGEEGISQVLNVVFTCGAVPMADKDVLDDDDQILVYYGAADAVIGVAIAKISDLVTKEALKEDV